MKLGVSACLLQPEVILQLGWVVAGRNLPRDCDVGPALQAACRAAKKVQRVHPCLEPRGSSRPCSSGSLPRRSLRSKIYKR